MRAPKIDKIIGLSLEQLREQATKSNLYRPDLTVMSVRKERIQTPPPMQQTPPVSSLQITKKSAPVEQPISTTTFETPDALHLITQIPAILKAHPGEITIHIGKLEAKVDTTGLSHIQKLLG